ncbi:hypothetical protein [Carnobacterium divergens]|uniref:hypothetical protein n=1 Tax=Carnobacterium divergens TaxID=2748 RepID=UPI00107182E8|nr:hypothetical protein [Carnobacterium divergens]TFI70528.1 hypothetical protein CKN81_10150 [Carnobacterium divergens]
MKKKGKSRVEKKTKRTRKQFIYLGLAIVVVALGGVIFYYSNFGTTGNTNEVDNPENNPSTATGFSVVANGEKPIIKYLLGDNGVVYETASNGAFSDCFYVADNTGNLTALYEPNTQKSFKVSEDKDAQQKLKEILTTYTN